MAGTTNQRGHLLQVRSVKEEGYSGPSVTTAPGTMDTGAPASFPGSEDRMPVARGFNMQPEIGKPQPQTQVSEHLSWQAIQGKGSTDSTPTEMWSGVDAGALNQMGDHQPMAGVVPKNKPPF